MKTMLIFQFFLGQNERLTSIMFEEQILKDKSSSISLECYVDTAVNLGIYSYATAVSTLSLQNFWTETIGDESME